VEEANSSLPPINEGMVVGASEPIITECLGRDRESAVEGENCDQPGGEKGGFEAAKPQAMEMGLGNNCTAERVMRILRVGMSDSNGDWDT
jgi:hypothetical protein